jgi:lipopolysaccharide transport system ATP-binding protein
MSRDLFLGTDYTQQATAPGNEYIRVSRVELIPVYMNQEQIIDVRTELRILFEFNYLVKEAGELLVNLQVFTNAGELIFELSSKNYTFRNGVVKGESRIPGNFLNDGLYYVSLAFVRNSTTRLFYFESCLSFDVEDYKDSGDWQGKWAGVVRPSFPIELIQEPDPL